MTRLVIFLEYDDDLLAPEITRGYDETESIPTPAQLIEELAQEGSFSDLVDQDFLGHPTDIRWWIAPG